jgi:hypothetical protein
MKTYSKQHNTEQNTNEYLDLLASVFFLSNFFSEIVVIEVSLL